MEAKHKNMLRLGIFSNKARLFFTYKFLIWKSK